MAPGVSTLLDGNPENNFLERAVTYNPGGLLDGGTPHATCTARYAWVSCDCRDRGDRSEQSAAAARGALVSTDVKASAQGRSSSSAMPSSPTPAESRSRM